MSCFTRSWPCSGSFSPCRSPRGCDGAKCCAPRTTARGCGAYVPAVPPSLLVQFLAPPFFLPLERTSGPAPLLFRETFRPPKEAPQGVRVNGLLRDYHPARLESQDLVPGFCYHNAKLHWEFVDPVR